MYEKDRELINRMLAGEELAFHEFFEAYAGRLAAFAARRSALPAATIEDIVQNTFIKAIRKLGGFRLESSLFTWLCQICRYELVDLHRKSTRRGGHDMQQQALATETLLQLRGEAEDPLQQLEAREHRSAVARTLNDLPERYSQALEWKYGDGFSVEEVAQMLGLSTIAAQSLLQRAREAFKESWGRQLVQ